MAYQERLNVTRPCWFVVKKTVSLILLTIPMVLAAQRAPAPAGIAKPSPAIPVRPPVAIGGQNGVASPGFLTPSANPARQDGGQTPSLVRPVSRPVVVTPQTQPSRTQPQMARATMAPALAPVVRVPDPPLVVPPAPPAPSADPAGLAAVDFQQGKLTVAASNANLGRVLRLIAEKTGATIEVTPELAAEPIVARLGPGSPDEVLTTLLASPRIDFIIMGSDAQGQLKRVVVRKRAAFGREPLMQSKPSQPQDEENASAEVEEAKPPL